MLSIFKPTIDKTTQAIVSPLGKMPPNVLTLIGIVPSLLFFLVMINGHFIWGLIIFLGNAFDMLDGAVAKRFHKVTAFGGFLDSMCDRIADFLIITAFGFAGLVNWPIVLTLLLLTYLISYSRARAELASKTKKKFAVGIIERTERLVLIWVGLLVFILFPQANVLEIVFLLLIFLSFITFCQRVFAAYKKL